MLQPPSQAPQPPQHPQLPQHPQPLQPGCSFMKLLTAPAHRGETKTRAGEGLAEATQPRAGRGSGCVPGSLSPPHPQERLLVFLPDGFLYVEVKAKEAGGGLVPRSASCGPAVPGLPASGRAFARFSQGWAGLRGRTESRGSWGGGWPCAGGPRGPRPAGRRSCGQEDRAAAFPVWPILLPWAAQPFARGLSQRVTSLSPVPRVTSGHTPAGTLCWETGVIGLGARRPPHVGRSLGGNMGPQTEAEGRPWLQEAESPTRPTRPTAASLVA